ncbi:MAG: ribonuclease D [Raoultibacter sp.]
MYIANQEMLTSFVERARASSVLAIDTEFLREKTYYARLCLLQMATDTEVVVVDPFEVEDLGVLGILLSDEHIVKLFHAGSQDVEILYREVGVMPTPLFDTQVAAALLGQTQQVGYGALVQSECGVVLKKIDSFTDWSRRPLSDSQKQYAAEDVIYLPKMYEQMKASLIEKGRLHWLDQDFRELANPQRYDSDPRQRYKHLKRASQLGPRQLSAAREVAAWREELARKRDLPRKWVMTDEQIVEVCKRSARSIDELFMVRGLSDSLSTAQARTVVALIEKGLDADELTWPHMKHMKKGEANVDVEVDFMCALVRLRAKENNVAFQTLSSRDDLVQMARGHYEEVDMLHGWRKELIGDELLDLLAGKITLSIEEGKLKVTNISQ